MRSRPGKLRRLTALVTSAVLYAALLSPVSPAVAEAPPPARLCAAQTATLLAFKARVAAHNAKPHHFLLPRQAAAYSAYNAEAARLRAEQPGIVARLRACIDAMLVLADGKPNSPAVPTPTKRAEKRIADALNKLPAGWRPPPPPARGKNWEVPAPLQPLYLALRSHNPREMGAAALQGRLPPVPGSRDPAYPPSSGMTIGGLTPDHINPLAQVIQMPGFTELTPRNMFLMAHAPINLQWMSYKANLSKSSRSVLGMSDVSPAWKALQVQLEDRTRRRLQDIIDKLLKSQG
ncbi:hypothetical protein [Sphaerisporangium dianthi]|uniref:DUF305 domain-containing protein n=1 Tax=Sphaerisporangium dianthi TaxID=1436120 RepID=A0ABV9CSN1_9ACTN